jgi:hypothetical protein
MSSPLRVAPVLLPPSLGVVILLCVKLDAKRRIPGGERVGSCQERANSPHHWQRGKPAQQTAPRLVLPQLPGQVIEAIVVHEQTPARAHIDGHSIQVGSIIAAAGTLLASRFLSNPPREQERLPLRQDLVPPLLRYNSCILSVSAPLLPVGLALVSRKDCQ